MFKELFKNFEDTSPVENQTESGPDDKERAKKEKYLESRRAKIDKALESNRFQKAREILTADFGGKSYSQEIQIELEARVMPLIREKVLKAIVNGNGEELVQALEYLNGYLRNFDVEQRTALIGPDDLKEVPQEILRSPEIIDAIHSHLIKEFEIGYSQPEVFLDEIEKFSRLGFISKEEIVQLPQIKEIARRCLNSDYPRRSFSQFTPRTLMGVPSPSVVELKKIFLELGISVSEEGETYEI